MSPWISTSVGRTHVDGYCCFSVARRSTRRSREDWPSRSRPRPSSPANWSSPNLVSQTGRGRRGQHRARGQLDRRGVAALSVKADQRVRADQLGLSRPDLHSPAMAAMLTQRDGPDPTIQNNDHLELVDKRRDRGNPAEAVQQTHSTRRTGGACGLPTTCPRPRRRALFSSDLEAQTTSVLQAGRAPHHLTRRPNLTITLDRRVADTMSL